MDPARLHSTPARSASLNAVDDLYKYSSLLLVPSSDSAPAPAPFRRRLSLCRRLAWCGNPLITRVSVQYT